MRDRIEKSIFLKAPRTKVWRTLTDAKTFGAWFGVEVEGEFRAGASTWAMSRHPGYEGRFEMVIEEMVPEKKFSWRWHPGAPGKDYTSEPHTLVVFELAETPEGTLLTVVETGFAALPAARRDAAYKDNTGGWDAQMASIERYVDQAA